MTDPIAVDVPGKPAFSRTTPIPAAAAPLLEALTGAAAPLPSAAAPAAPPPATSAPAAPPPVVGAAKVEPPKPAAPKVEPPKVEAPKVEAPKAEPPKAVTPKPAITPAPAAPAAPAPDAITTAVTAAATVAATAAGVPAPLAAPAAGLLARFTKKQLTVGAAVCSLLVGAGALRLVFPVGSATTPTESASAPNAKITLGLPPSSPPSETPKNDGGDHDSSKKSPETGTQPAPVSNTNGNALPKVPEKPSALGHTQVVPSTGPGAPAEPKMPPPTAAETARKSLGTDPQPAVLTQLPVPSPVIDPAPSGSVIPIGGSTVPDPLAPKLPALPAVEPVPALPPSGVTPPNLTPEKPPQSTAPGTTPPAAPGNPPGSSVAPAFPTLPGDTKQPTVPKREEFPKPPNVAPPSLDVTPPTTSVIPSPPKLDVPTPTGGTSGAGAPATPAPPKLDVLPAPTGGASGPSALVVPPPSIQPSDLGPAPPTEPKVNPMVGSPPPLPTPPAAGPSMTTRVDPMESPLTAPPTPPTGSPNVPLPGNTGGATVPPSTLPALPGGNTGTGPVGTPAPDLFPPAGPDSAPKRPTATDVKPPSAAPALDPSNTVTRAPSGGAMEFTKPEGKTEPKPSRPEVAPKTTFDVDVYDPKSNDTYETISLEFYNDRRFAAALRAYNQGQPLQGGRYVNVPPVHVLKRQFPTQSGGPVGARTGAPAPTGDAPNWSAAPAARTDAATGRTTFVVPRGGMTLPQIARQTMGSEQYWRDIFDMNPQFRADELLPAGTELRLPANAKLP